VIDDDPDALAICERALGAAGYRTATATSGEAGLARLEMLRPACVVLDLVMPGTDGFAVARQIRARPDWAALPILVFTGLPRQTETDARAAGGTAFCTKPVEPRRLVAEVRRLCPPA
jgi:CheY-like chemotaxis protein